jgi:flagellin
MGLRIRTNISALEAQKNLRQNTIESETEYAKLSSGKRVNKAADDAAGLAMAKSMDAKIRGMRQATRNANDGVSLIQVAEGSLNETHNILGRLRELSIQSASDTVGEEERSYLDKEYQNLVDEVDRIAATTTFTGINLINGDSGIDQMDFHVGAFAGDDNKISYDPNETDATAGNLGISGTGVSDKGDANDSIAEIDNAIVMVSKFRADLGANQSRLSSTIKNLEIQTLNQDNARAGIEDADVAFSTAKLASANVLKQAAISTLAQANNIPGSALRLIG